MEPVYVVVVMGNALAVLTELLWWLSKVECHAVAGVEVWTTGGGAQNLLGLAADSAWRELKQEIGPLPALKGPGTPVSTWPGIRVRCFERDGEPLQDVRRGSGGGERSAL